MTETHKDYYVSYDWCPQGTMLHMRNASFQAAFCGSFPLYPISPRMDMESALYWYNVGAKGGLGTGNETKI